MKLARFQRPELSNWGSTFDQLWNLRDEINRFFEPFNGGSNGLDAFNAWAPALDVYEDKDNIMVKAEVPGMRKEDIEISLHENTLTIAGERKNEKKYEGSQTAREERFFGRFQRSFTLPKAVDGSKVKASYKDGVLTVTLPKSAEAKPRQIAVQS
jgi:HSP20 family protein